MIFLKDKTVQLLIFICFIKLLTLWKYHLLTYIHITFHLKTFNSYPFTNTQYTPVNAIFLTSFLNWVNWVLERFISMIWFIKKIELAPGWELCVPGGQSSSQTTRPHLFLSEVTLPQRNVSKLWDVCHSDYCVKPHSQAEQTSMLRVINCSHAMYQGTKWIIITTYNTMQCGLSYQNNTWNGASI